MGLFVTFEGPEGSGKSTQIQLLCAYLQARHLPAVRTREPGGTRIGDRIRDVILSPEHAELLPPTEFLLFSASRAQLVAQFIRPHLQAGDIVLCDRYADSSLAYQGYAHGLDLSALRQVTQFATGGLKPDLTFYFDLDVSAGLRRKRDGDSPLDRLDSQAIEFHERVRRGYLAMAEEEPQRWVVVDAAQRVEEIQQQVRQVLDRFLSARSTTRAEEAE
jgi:dTMP kinase